MNLQERDWVRSYSIFSRHSVDIRSVPVPFLGDSLSINLGFLFSVIVLQIDAKKLAALLGNRRAGLAGAVLGAALMLIAWQVRPDWLEGVIRFDRLFFIVNGVGCVLLVFGMTAVLGRKSTTGILPSVLSVGLAFITTLIRLLVPLL